MAFVDMTTWIPVDEAKAKIAELIANGTYTKQQIKKSSNLFANRKDKTDGYICRILVEAGIHPELEAPKKEKKSRAAKKENAKPVTEQTDNNVDNKRYVVTAEPINKDEGLFLIEKGGKYWIEKQKIGSNEKEIISAIVETEQDASMLWRTTLAKYRAA